MRFKRTVQLISTLVIISAVLVTVISVSAKESVELIIPNSQQSIRMSKSSTNPSDIEPILKSSSLINDYKSETTVVQPTSTVKSQPENTPTAEVKVAAPTPSVTDTKTNPQTDVQPAPPQSTPSTKKSKTEKNSDKKAVKSSESSTVSPAVNSIDPVV